MKYGKQHQFFWNKVIFHFQNSLAYLLGILGLERTSSNKMLMIWSETGCKFPGCIFQKGIPYHLCNKNRLSCPPDVWILNTFFIVSCSFVNPWKYLENEFEHTLAYPFMWHICIKKKRQTCGASYASTCDHGNDTLVLVCLFVVNPAKIQLYTRASSPRCPVPGEGGTPTISLYHWSYLFYQPIINQSIWSTSLIRKFISTCIHTMKYGEWDITN